MLLNFMYLLTYYFTGYGSAESEEYVYLFPYDITIYKGADQSLARPTSRCILFDGENISFDASLVTYINSTNIPPIMIINRIYEHQNLPSLWLVSFLVGLRTNQHPRTVCLQAKLLYFSLILQSCL